MGSHITDQTVARSARSSIEMADNVELKEAFKLFDMDGDGMITKDELRKLVEKVGGSMTEGEAKGLIHQADKDATRASTSPSSPNCGPPSRARERARRRSGRSSPSWTRTTVASSLKMR